jgi:hypothetical protein
MPALGAPARDAPIVLPGPTPIEPVLPDVLPAVGQFEVLDPIVDLVAVDVVDDLVGPQRAPEMLLHDQPVLGNPSAVRLTDDDVAIAEGSAAPPCPVLGPLQRPALARPRAELAPPPGDFGGLGEEFGPAGFAPPWLTSPGRFVGAGSRAEPPATPLAATRERREDLAALLANDVDSGSLGLPHDRLSGRSLQPTGSSSKSHLYSSSPTSST